jgi:hypothetical protein
MNSQYIAPACPTCRKMRNHLGGLQALRAHYWREFTNVLLLPPKLAARHKYQHLLGAWSAVDDSYWRHCRAFAVHLGQHWGQVVVASDAYGR